MGSSRVIGEKPRMDSENRYQETRAHPSIALPDYRLEQKNADKRGVSSPLGCGTEARKPFNLFAHLDAVGTGNAMGVARIRETQKRNKATRS